MKTKIMLFLAVCATALSSCKEDTAFGGGNWFIPLALAVGFITSIVRYANYRKGKNNGANYAWVYAIILFAAFILAVWRMIAER